MKTIKEILYEIDVLENKSLEQSKRQISESDVNFEFEKKLINMALGKAVAYGHIKSLLSKNYQWPNKK